MPHHTTSCISPWGRTHTGTHTDVHTKSILRNQAHPSHRPARTWFNYKFLIIGVLAISCGEVELLVRIFVTVL